MQRSAWIPWAFLMGMVLVIGVNAGMVAVAVSTSSGVTIDRPYERGRRYEAVLAAAARQDALGWSADIQLAGDMLVVTLRNRAGQMLPATLSGSLQRPAEPDARPLQWRSIAPGQWSALITGVRRGQWDARLAFVGPDGAAFEARQRFLLP